MIITTILLTILVTIIIYFEYKIKQINKQYNELETKVNEMIQKEKDEISNQIESIEEYIRESEERINKMNEEEVIERIETKEKELKNDYHFELTGNQLKKITEKLLNQSKDIDETKNNVAMIRSVSETSSEEIVKINKRMDKIEEQHKEEFVVNENIMKESITNIQQETYFRIDNLTKRVDEMNISDNKKQLMKLEYSLELLKKKQQENNQTNEFQNKLTERIDEIEREIKEKKVTIKTIKDTVCDTMKIQIDSNDSKSIVE